MTARHKRRLGKVWRVTRHVNETPELLFMGTNGECQRWIHRIGLYKSYKRGLIRLGQTIT